MVNAEVCVFRNGALASAVLGVQTRREVLLVVVPEVSPIRVTLLTVSMRSCPPQCALIMVERAVDTETTLVFRRNLLDRLLVVRAGIVLQVRVSAVNVGWATLIDRKGERSDTF